MISIAELRLSRPLAESYFRNNRTSGQKSLRCFPHCSLCGHKASGFCGEAIDATLVIHKTGILTHTSSSDILSKYDVIGEIRPADSPHLSSMINVDVDFINSRIRDSRNPRSGGELLMGNIKEIVELPTYFELFITLNEQRASYDYSWKSNRWSGHQVGHVIDIIILDKFTDFNDSGHGSLSGCGGVGPNNDPSKLQIHANICTDPFILVSTHKNPPSKKTQKQRQTQKNMNDNDTAGKVVTVNPVAMSGKTQATATAVSYIQVTEAAYTAAKPTADKARVRESVRRAEKTKSKPIDRVNGTSKRSKAIEMSISRTTATAITTTTAATDRRSVAVPGIDESDIDISSYQWFDLDSVCGCACAAMDSSVPGPVPVSELNTKNRQMPHHRHHSDHHSGHHSGHLPDHHRPDHHHPDHHRRRHHRRRHHHHRHHYEQDRYSDSVSDSVAVQLPSAVMVEYSLVRPSAYLFDMSVHEERTKKMMIIKNRCDPTASCYQPWTRSPHSEYIAVDVDVDIAAPATDNTATAGRDRGGERGKDRERGGRCFLSSEFADDDDDSNTISSDSDSGSDSGSDGEGYNYFLRSGSSSSVTALSLSQSSQSTSLPWGNGTEPLWSHQYHDTRNTTSTTMGAVDSSLHIDVGVGVSVHMNVEDGQGQIALPLRC